MDHLVPPRPDEEQHEQARHDQLHPFLQALPTPASISDSLTTPTLARSIPSMAAVTPLTISAVVNSDPSPVVSAYEAGASNPLFSHASLTVDNLNDFNLTLGGALAPICISPPPPPPPQQRSGPDLRLPSFDALGISTPLPGLLSRSQVGLPFATSPDLLPKRPIFGVGGGGRAVQSPVKHYLSTLTPPAEGGEPDWRPPVTSAALDSPNTDPDSTQTASAPSTSLATTPSIPTANAASSDAEAPAIPGTLGPDDKWIEGAVLTLTERLIHPPFVTHPLRILSHALPCPSPSGHIFTKVIGKFHASTPSSSTVWTNVFHAVPGRLTLSDLPLTSPPSTPGPPVGGEDYFTQKVFGSAVAISDYSAELAALPRSPRPVVPPESIDISICERYIPPTTTNEFAEMFNASGTSILVDRLVELSPNNGSLVFIYPTRSGAQTFMQHYLGPILDPILRSMCVVHGLEFELGESLGHMPAVDKMLEHDEMTAQLAGLCTALSDPDEASQKFRGRRAEFAITYASTREVVLERQVWAQDWWTKQEKSRVREVVTRYAQKARQKRRYDQRVYESSKPPELIKELLDGVMKKPYPRNREPQEGIQVSVFVVTRMM